MVDLSEYHDARILRLLEFRVSRDFPVDAEQAAFIAELDRAERDPPGLLRLSLRADGFAAANDNLYRLQRSE